MHNIYTLTASFGYVMLDQWESIFVPHVARIAQRVSLAHSQLIDFRSLHLFVHGVASLRFVERVVGVSWISVKTSGWEVICVLYILLHGGFELLGSLDLGWNGQRSPFNNIEFSKFEASWHVAFKSVLFGICISEWLWSIEFSNWEVWMMLLILWFIKLCHVCISSSDFLI